MNAIILLAVSIHLSIQTGNASAATLLDAISQVESGANDFAVGTHQERSRYQIRALTWNSYTNSTRHACPETARRVAEAHRTWLQQSFRQSTGRNASDYDIAVCWRIGFDRYRQIQFNPQRLTKGTRVYAQRVINIKENTK